MALLSAHCMCVRVRVTDLLLHHVVCHVVCTAAVETAAYTLNALGDRVNLTRARHLDTDDADAGTDADGGGMGGRDEVRFNAAAVLTSVDLMATDGVVHVVDQLTVPNDGPYARPMLAALSCCLSVCLSQVVVRIVD